MLSIITQPTNKPVTLEEVKHHARLALDDNSEDALLELMIDAATKSAEFETNRSLINRTIRIKEYAALKIELPKPPLVSISSVKLIDSDGVETTLTTDDYSIDDVGLVPELHFDSIGAAKYVQVEYVAGYGSSASNVPESIRKWILCRVNTLYEYREYFMNGSLNDFPKSFIDSLLDDYRIVSAH